MNLDTYKNRIGRDCTQISNKSEACLGTVRGSRQGMTCEGHRGGGPYRSPEDVEREQLVLRERSLKMAEEVAQAAKARAIADEARRWFRPHIESAKVVPSSSWWSAMPDHLLKMVFSMLGEGVGGIWDSRDQPLKARVEACGLPAIAEILRRKMAWPEGAYQLALAPKKGKISTMLPKLRGGRQATFSAEDLHLDLSPIDDDTLLIWHGCAAQVVDYSALDWGTRQVSNFLYDATQAELHTRGIQPQFLLDIETRC